MRNENSTHMRLQLAGVLLAGLPCVSLAHGGEEYRSAADEQAVIEEQDGRSFRVIEGRFMIFAEVKSRAGRQSVSLIIGSPEPGEPLDLALLPSVLSALALSDEETAVILVGPDGFVSPPVARDWLTMYELTDEDRNFLTRNALVFEDYPFAGTVSPVHLDTTGTGGFSLADQGAAP